MVREKGTWMDFTIWLLGLHSPDHQIGGIHLHNERFGEVSLNQDGRRGEALFHSIESLLGRGALLKGNLGEVRWVKGKGMGLKSRIKRWWKFAIPRSLWSCRLFSGSSHSTTALMTTAGLPATEHCDWTGHGTHFFFSSRCCKTKWTHALKQT